MSAFWLLSLLLLAFGFGVLVWTFVWVARLLARRSARAASAAAAPPSESEGEEELEVDTDEDVVALEKRRTGTGVNATLGLILSVLACLLFWLSPLTLVLTLAGLWFSSNALWYGMTLFGVFVARAALGIALAVGSGGLHFGYRTGLFTLPF